MIRFSLLERLAKTYVTFIRSMTDIATLWGQTVNIDKSTMFFGVNTTVATRTVIKDSLGSKVVEDPGK